MPADVAIIIVTYNSEKQISDCLESIIAQTTEVNFEIVVVDNLSADSTPTIVKKSFPDVQLIEPGRNLGFAKAVNLAAKQVDSQYLLLLNPDTQILDHAVDKVYAFAIAYPEHGFYGGRTLKEDGTTLEPSSCWGQPTLWSLFSFATGLSTIFKHNSFFDPESLGSWQRNTVREVGVITGCFLLVEKTAWDAIEGFDEHYWLYGEDVDLAMRASKAGYRPVICPDAVVVHEIGQSSTSGQKMIWLYRGKVSLIKRHWGGLARSLALTFLKSGVRLRALAYGLKGDKGNAWVTGWARRTEWEQGHTE